MNLEELLIPNPRFFKRAGAERAERAETQQRRSRQSPPLEAEKGGKLGVLGQIRPNPLRWAETETPAPRGFPPNLPNPPAPKPEIEKPLPVTLEYFETQGVDLLREDLAFLHWLLPRDTARRNAYIARYVSVWREAMDAEPMAHRKTNQGRRAANTWLRGRAGGRGV